MTASEGGHRDAHIRRVGGDALAAGPQNGMDAVVAVHRRAARPRLALVAGRRRVPEVVAARPLQDIPAGRRHVAELGDGPLQNRLGQHRVVLDDGGVVRQVRVGDQRADPQAAVRHRLDLGQRQAARRPSSRDGVSTFSLIRSIRVVPPARNRAGFSSAPGAPPATAPVLMAAPRHPGLGILKRVHCRLLSERPEWRRRCWCTRRSGRGYRSCSRARRRRPARLAPSREPPRS